MSSEPERLRIQAALLELLAYWPADEETQPLHLVNGYDVFGEDDDLEDDDLEDDVDLAAFMTALEEDEPEEEEPPQVTRRVRVTVRRPEEA